MPGAKPMRVRGSLLEKGSEGGGRPDGERLLCQFVRSTTDVSYHIFSNQVECGNSPVIHIHRATIFLRRVGRKRPPRPTFLSYPPWAGMVGNSIPQTTMLRYISRISRHARPHPRILRYVASEAHGSGGGGRGGGGGGGGGGWGHDDEHHDDRHDENHTRRWLLAVLPILAGLTTASTAHAKKFSVFTSSPPNAPSLSPADERALGDLRHALNAFWADALADASLDDQRSAAQQRASSSASSGTAGPLSPATRALLLASLEVSATTDGIEVTCAVAPSFEKTASAALRRLASSLCEQVTSSWTSGRNLAVTGHRRGESGPLTMSLSPPTDRTPTSKDGDGTGIDRAWRIRITLPLSILQSPLLTTGTLAERLTGVLEAAAGLESREGADAMSQISDAEWLASVMGGFGLPFLPGFGAMDGTGIPGMNGMSDQDGGDAPGWGDIFGMSPPSTSYSSYTSSYGSGVDGIGDGGSGTATNTNMRARARAPTPAERQAALTRATAEELRRMGMDVVLPPAMAGEEDALDTEETSNSRKGRGKGKGLGKGSGSDPSRYVDWEGVQGYQAQKSAIETSVLLALRHQDVYRQVLQATRRDGDSTPLPRAVLLTGPPGCGKTLMARKVAREAGVPMVHGE